MPVEIKELIIRAVATDDHTPGAASPQGLPKTASAGTGTSSEDQQALVEACVRRVLKILKQSNER